MSALRRFPRIAIVAGIALIGVSLWVRHQVKLQQARNALDAERTQLAALNNRVAAATEALEATQRNLKTETAARDELVSNVAKAERALAAVAPETRWAEPPASLPEWNSESPYIWLRKEMVPKFPVSAFTEDGELQPQVGYVFTVDPVSQRRLNEKLKQLLAQYRALEAAKAERSEEHLPGIAGQKGEKITIRVQPLPEEGARIKQQFEEAMVQSLGEQRANLLMEVGETWLGTEFAQFGAEPKIISVIRHAGGSFNVSVKTGPSWVSTGGPLDTVKNFVPPHLRPLFADLLDRNRAVDSAKAGQ